MADIFRAVRVAVQNRLASVPYGFNAKYAAVQSAYSQRDGSAIPDLLFDWNDGSVNVAWGRIPADLVEESTPFQYPLLTIDADRSQQDGYPQRIKFKQFSGVVQALIEVHLSWAQEGVTDFATWPDAVIDAMFASINDPNIPQAWGANLVFSGDLAAVKSQVMMAGENWRRTISFPCTFRVIV
jgi:hypothetical protein